jgi:hypothetical protein
MVSVAAGQTLFPLSELVHVVPPPTGNVCLRFAYGDLVAARTRFRALTSSPWRCPRIARWFRRPRLVRDGRCWWSIRNGWPMPPSVNNNAATGRV